MGTVSEQNFYIVYDGPSLESSEMDVRQLAPALHSIGDLLESANRVVHKGAFRVKVKVRGSFKTGCFGIDFKATYDSLIPLLTHESVEAALNLAGLLGFLGTAGGGLFGLIKWLKNRPIKKIIELNDGKVRVEIDEDSLDVERGVIELFRDLEVRKALQGVVYEPLEHRGVDFFGAGKNRDDLVKVRKEEAVYFVAPEAPEELLSESTRETMVKVVNVAFQEDNMWRLYDGEKTFYAAMEHGEFLEEVQNNERSFAKDDLFRIRLRQKQFLGEKGKVKVEYAVEEVLEHRSAARQIDLPFEKG